MQSAAAQVLKAINGYEQAIESALVLNAARNVLSPRTRAILGQTVADGDWAGRVSSHSVTYSAAGLARIEDLARDLIARLFGHRHVELRAPTGSVANGLAAVGLTAPGDTVWLPPSWAFGHKSVGKDGYPGTAARVVRELPWDAGLMQPDLDQLRAALRGKSPSLVVLGTSRPLFPEPYADIAAIVWESGGKLLYDGAHLLGLIAAGAYPNPLRAGFDTLSGSTHKTMPGPTGGLIVCAAAAHHEQIGTLADAWLSTYSSSRLAALAYTLAEMEAVGAAYGKQVVTNAKALGGELAGRGFAVVGADHGFTATHQVLVDVTGVGKAQETAPRLAAAGILVNGPSRVDRRVRNTAEDGLWLRLGTSAITRQGMGTEEMKTIASILARVLIAYDDPAQVRLSVGELLRRHKSVAFTLDDIVPA